MFLRAVVRFQIGWESKDLCNYSMRNGQPMHQTEVIFFPRFCVLLCSFILPLPLYTGYLVDHTATVLLCFYRALPSIGFIFRITMDLWLDSSFHCTDSRGENKLCLLSPMQAVGFSRYQSTVISGRHKELELWGEEGSRPQGSKM